MKQPTLLTPNEAARAIDMANLALEQEERSDFGHWIRGTLSLNLEREHDTAIAHAERSLEINPHFAAALRLKGEALCFAGNTDIGVPILDDLLTADPRAPANGIVLWDLALAHFAIGDASAALQAIDDALLRMRTMPELYLARAAILSELNRVDDARLIVENLIPDHSGVSLAGIRRPPFKDSGIVQKYLDVLREAGLPE